jgi:hypothetical protein
VRVLSGAPEFVETGQQNRGHHLVRDSPGRCDNANHAGGYQRGRQTEDFIWQIASGDAGFASGQDAEAEGRRWSTEQVADGQRVTAGQEERALHGPGGIRFAVA